MRMYKRSLSDGTVRGFALGLAIGNLLTVAALALAGTARADGYLDAAEEDYAVTYGPSAICPVIDEYRATGVTAAFRVIVGDGFTADSAVDVINASVEVFCPRNWPLLVAIGEQARGGTVA